MGQSPFAKRAASAELAGVAKRRSTRVDYVCPIVVSGHDAATGQSFREETETAIVNLHGCKLRTQHQVLVGMMVSLDCPATQTSAKGVCVHIFDSQPDGGTHEIAVQLVKPQNMWGLKDPPPDWEVIARELVTGKSVPRVTTAPAAPAASQAAPSAGPDGVRPVPQARGPLGPKADGSPPSAAPAGLPDPETQLAILEQRAAQLMEAVLQILRTQAESFVRDTIDTFRQQIGALVKQAEEQIHKGAEKTYEDVEGSLMTLRGDLAVQLTQRTDQIVANAEEALRSKVGEMFASMLKPAPKK